MAGGLGRDEWLSASPFARLATLASTRGISAARLTPWKFNISREKYTIPKRKGSSSKHHFSGDMLNFGGVVSKTLVQTTVTSGDDDWS